MEVWFIEAVGKRQSLEKTLQKMGREATVFATSGYVKEYGPGGLGIGRDLSEPGRGVHNQKIVDRLCELAKEADEIYVATDADGAGDVIACDIADIIRPLVSTHLHRVRLSGIDQVSVMMALEAIGPIDYRMAAPGRAQAIIDRLIGFTYSKPKLSIGRRQTALLSVVEETKHIDLLARYTIVAPANDGGHPFSIELGADDVVRKEHLDLLLKSSIRPVKPGDLAYLGFTPKHFGDVLVSLSDVAKASESPASIADLSMNCQELYMTGRLSYPRAKMRGYSQQTVDLVKKHAGYLNPEAVPNPKVVGVQGEGAHDSLYPKGHIQQNVVEGLGTPEGILTEIGNAAVRATHLWPGQIPDKDDLRAALVETGLPDFVASSLSARRWVRWDGAPPLGTKKATKSSMFMREPDAALLDLAIQNNIATPASWTELVRGTMNGLVKSSGSHIELTQLGKASLDAAPDFLKDVAFSANLEEALQNTPVDNSAEPWKRLTSQVVNMLPSEVRADIRNTMINNPVPKAMTPEEMGIDMDAAVPDTRQALRYAPAPSNLH